MLDVLMDRRIHRANPIDWNAFANGEKKLSKSAKPN
jgi:hypothetical protein